MAQPYVIACDLGTSGVKVIACDVSSGEILGSVTEQYPLYVDGVNAEQDPQDYWDAICRGSRCLTESGLPAEDCAGLVFGTQWRGLIPVSGDGKVLRRGIIWMDKRATAEAEELNRALGRDLFCQADYWPKLMWFRKHEPELYQASAYILEPNAFLKWKATGQFYSDITNHYARAYHGERDAFYRIILEKAGLDQQKFPPLCEPSQQIGAVTPEAAAQLGLPAGTPVFGGCCDIPALAIGAGCSRPGDVHAYLGTSGWLGHIQPIDPQATYVPSLDRQHDVGFYGMGVSVGPSTQWMLDTFFREEKERYGKAVWSHLEEQMDRVPAGSGRLLAAPWFFGGRPPLSSAAARGIFFNLNNTHTRIHMLKAIFEGSGYILRQNLETLNASRTEPVASITVCGGGALNRCWMQALADILQVEIKVPVEAQSIGSVGVAYCALVGLGAVENFDSIAQSIRYEHVYQPIPAHFAEYDLLYREFTQLHSRLYDAFAALNI